MHPVHGADSPGSLDVSVAESDRWLPWLAVLLAAAGPGLAIAKARLLTPLSRPRKIVAVDLNYADHAAEGQLGAWLEAAVEPPYGSVGSAVGAMTSTRLAAAARPHHHRTSVATPAISMAAPIVPTAFSEPVVEK